MRAEKKKKNHKKPIFDINYIHIHAYIYICTMRLLTKQLDIMITRLAVELDQTCN